MHATCLTHFILPDLITLILFSMWYKYQVPYYAVVSSPLFLSPSYVQVLFSALVKLAHQISSFSTAAEVLYFFTFLFTLDAVAT